MPGIAKSEKSAAESPQTVKVTFVRDFTLPAGPYDESPPAQDFKNGDTAEIPADRADEVFLSYSARPHDPRLARVYGFTPPAEEEKKES